MYGAATTFNNHGAPWFSEIADPFCREQWTPTFAKQCFLILMNRATTFGKILRNYLVNPKEIPNISVVNINPELLPISDTESVEFREKSLRL